ncbi:unnamed protein product [Vicia faba]|uniref:non-specific serine/threonine protein kinase n=1 Tax=Vicia faba TaxID=3906 RepID=A0AAV1A8R8_VICFA|nr:unnamed protein product [Vicia faba]
MPQQQSPHVVQGAQQQPSQSAQPVQQQQNSQLAQPTQQPGLHQARPQMMQPQGQQMMQYQGQQFQQMHHQVPPQRIRPQQFGQGNPQDHGTHIVQLQAPQFTPQNMHYMGYQQNMITPSPRQPNSQQVHPNMTPSGQPTPQHNMHNQPFENQQDFKPAIPKVEETEFKNGSQVGFSPSQYQQRSSLPVQNNPNIPAEISSGQVSNSGVNSGQPQQFRGFSGSMQQPTPTMQSQQGDKEFFGRDWDTRMKIALDAARGLSYLHEDSQPCVIHRDFEASNILLENNFHVKVADFGLAKQAPEGGANYLSTRVMGTFGYVAPEYAMTGHLLVKSDVYSYGRSCRSNQTPKSNYSKKRS